MFWNDKKKLSYYRDPYSSETNWVQFKVIKSDVSHLIEF